MSDCQLTTLVKGVPPPDFDAITSALCNVWTDEVVDSVRLETIFLSSGSSHSIILFTARSGPREAKNQHCLGL